MINPPKPPEPPKPNIKDLETSLSFHQVKFTILLSANFWEGWNLFFIGPNESGVVITHHKIS